MPQDPLMTGDPLDAVKPVETAYYLPPSPTYHYDKIPQLDGFAEYDPENNPQQELISTPQLNVPWLPSQVDV